MLAKVAETGPYTNDGPRGLSEAVGNRDAVRTAGRYDQSRMRWIPVAVALVMTGTAPSQDAQLGALRATLARLHSKAPAATFGALAPGPELTVAKHQLERRRPQG